MFRDYCHHYFKKGFNIVPIKLNTKRPAIKDWSIYSTQRQTLSFVEELAVSHGECGIGLVTGKASGVVVFDNDLNPNNSGEKYLYDEINKIVPKSPVKKVGKKGESQFFKYNGEISRQLSYKIGAKVFQVADLLSDGRQVVLPPSIHPEINKPYYWEGARLEDVGCEGLPYFGDDTLDKIIALVNMHSSSLNVDEENSDVKLSGIGTRNNTLKKITIKLLNSGTQANEISRFLVEQDAELHEKPLFSDSDEFGSGIPEDNAKKFVDSISRTFDKSNKHESPMSLMPVVNNEKEFPVEALGNILMGAALEIRKVVQAPLALCCQSLLAAAATSVQAYYDIDLNGRTIPTSEFFLTIAASGERKTGVDKEVFKQHQFIERQKLIEYEKKLKSFKSKEKFIDQKFQKNLSKINELKDFEFENTKSADELEPPPKSPKTIAEDATTEGLQKMLHEGFGVAVIKSDEGGIFSSGYSFNKEQLARTVAMYSKFWDGSSVDRIRATSESMTIFKTRAVINLMMQPVLAKNFFNDPIHQGQGFLSRFLIVYPKSTVGYRLYNSENLQDSYPMKRYWGRVSELLEKPVPYCNESKMIEPEVIVLSEDAFQKYIDYHNQIESKMLPDGDYCNIKPFASKAAEHAIRLAGVLAVFNNPGVTNLSATDVGNGIKLMDYYFTEVQRCEQGLRVSQRIEMADQLRLWMVSKNHKIISIRFVCQKGPNALRDKKCASEAIQDLLDHKWLIPSLRQKIEGQWSNETWRLNENSK